MSDPKAAAAYHPGDAPVTRLDLDALREQFAEVAYRAEKTHDFGESWTEEFADESDSYKATYYAIADALLGILPVALAAERARADEAWNDGVASQANAQMAGARELVARAESAEARADQAERDVKRYEDRARENRELLDQFAARADQAEQRIADAPHGATCEVMRAFRPSAPCECWKSAAPTAEE